MVTEQLRVLVVMEDSLFERGVVQRLRQEPEIRVRVVRASDADLDSLLASFRPHASILDDGDAALRERILAVSPTTVVVGLSLECGVATLYQARSLEISSITELVSHLKSQGVLSRSSGVRGQGGAKSRERQSQGTLRSGKREASDHLKARL